MKAICAILLGAVLTTGTAFAAEEDRLDSYDADRARAASFARCELMSSALNRAICLRRAEWDHQAPIGETADYWSTRRLAERERTHNEALATRRAREQTAGR